MSAEARSRDAAASHSRHHLRIALWIFLAFSTLYVGLARGHFISTDEVGVYQTTRSLWEDGNLHTGRVGSSSPGRGGLYYSPYGVGQSVAALPLYGLGKWVGQLLETSGRADWVRTLAGPSIGREPARWGGDIEMFFVSLFNVFVTALLLALFFSFSVRLGASLAGSLAATALLGLAAYVGPFSTNFFQHSSEALFVLWSFYFLVSDAQRPDWRSRAWAGVLLGLAVVFRPQSLIAAPTLGLYLLWSVWERRDGGGVAGFVRMCSQQLPAFMLPALAGVVTHLGANYVKFEATVGIYGGSPFNSPFPTGLYGLLFSPGHSVFIYTPLLLLVPWTLVHFARRWRREAILILALASSYLLLYSSYVYWHGLYYLGPRYLMPTVPFLLLPLAGWMDADRAKVWFTVAPLALVGLWVQFVHFAANFWYVDLYEKYVTAWPPGTDFLFIPARSPILAHSRATLAWDLRVDLWLVNVYRAFGTARTLEVALPLLGLLGFCLWRLRQNLRATVDSLPERDT